MKRYIDAEKLIKAIEEKGLNCSFALKMERLDTLAIIDELQQEQPELSGYDKALLEVKSKVDEIYEETSIGLNEYDSGLYNGIAETCMKLRGFIKARLDSDEQPEDDLEKETKRWWKERLHLNPESQLWMDAHQSVSLARHFYELGLNARKDK